MANPQRKQSITKEPGYMDEPPDLIRATMDIDLDAVKMCIEADPTCITQLANGWNNAMHVCVAAGAARTTDIINFFLQETDIDLLLKNKDGRCPLDVAFAMGDMGAADLLEEPTLRQLQERYPEDKPDLSLL